MHARTLRGRWHKRSRKLSRLKVVKPVWGTWDVVRMVLSAMDSAYRRVGVGRRSTQYARESISACHRTRFHAGWNFKVMLARVYGHMGRIETRKAVRQLLFLLIIVSIVWCPPKSSNNSHNKHNTHGHRHAHACAIRRIDGQITIWTMTYNFNRVCTVI